MKEEKWIEQFYLTSDGESVLPPPLYNQLMEEGIEPEKVIVKIMKNHRARYQ
jgi:hypothetical protein